MTGVLEQLAARVERLEQIAAGGAQAAQPAQIAAGGAQAAQTVQVQPSATGAVTGDAVMALVNPLVEIPAAQSELKTAVSEMGFSDLSMVPQARYGEVHAKFKAIYDRYFPAQAQQQPAQGGGLTLGGGALAQQATATPAII